MNSPIKTDSGIYQEFIGCQEIALKLLGLLDFGELDALRSRTIGC